MKIPTLDEIKEFLATDQDEHPLLRGATGNPSCLLDDKPDEYFEGREEDDG